MKLLLLLFAFASLFFSSGLKMQIRNQTPLKNNRIALKFTEFYGRSDKDSDTCEVTPGKISRFGYLPDDKWYDIFEPSERVTHLSVVSNYLDVEDSEIYPISEKDKIYEIYLDANLNECDLTGKCRNKKDKKLKIAVP